MKKDVRTAATNSLGKGWSCLLATIDEILDSFFGIIILYERIFSHEIHLIQYQTPCWQGHDTSAMSPVRVFIRPGIAASFREWVEPPCCWFQEKDDCLAQCKYDVFAN